MEAGGEKKNHKWYARIGSPGNYKYFYSQQEVDAYKAKMSGGQTKTTAKSSNGSKGSSTKSSSGTKASTSKVSSKKATTSKEQKPNIASVSDTVNNVAKVAGKDKSEVNKVMSLVASKGWDSPEVAAAVRSLANNNEELGKKMLLHLRVAKTYEDGLNAKKKKTKDKLQHSGIIGSGHK